MFSVQMSVLAGLAFASWAEAIFTLAMLLPLLFFVMCALYLIRLLLCSVRRRSQLMPLAPLRSQMPSFERPGAANVTPPEETEAGGSGPCPRFILMLPAHNEEMVIGDALAALNRMAYARDAFSILVIADNCTDRTAEIAKHYGAAVLERFDNVAIGKGYALEWALNLLLNTKKDRVSERLPVGKPAPERNEDISELRDFDAIVVLDADTLVAPNLLQAFAQGLHSGQKAMQARYEVLNDEESWRTRLMRCALALAHIVKPMGREVLALSDGLKGNGMCFAREVVERVPWSGKSITEDIEYTLRLCRAGYRVAFVPETAVWAQMPTTGAQSESQRRRWEGGRYQLLVETAPGLLWEGIRSRSRILRDRAIELIIPPFAEMFAVPVVMLGICLLAAFLLHWRWAGFLSAAWLSVLLLQAGYLFGGLWAAKIPASVAMMALCAPGYIVWKFGVYGGMLLRRSTGGWKRTERRKLNG